MPCATDRTIKNEQTFLRKDSVVFENYSPKSFEEIEQVSGYTPDIGYTGVSTRLANGHHGHLISSSTGHVVHLPFDVLDSITVLHTHISSPITMVSCFSIDKNNYSATPLYRIRS